MSIVHLEDIVKTYPNVTALNHVSMKVEKGEIHALLGENGAGKSTLMKVLYGMTRPDSGRIEINHTPVEIENPMKAIKMGIGMVHQHFMLADAMDVVENIIVGAEPIKKGRVDYNRAKLEIEEMIRKFGFSVSPDALVEELTVGEKQQVEILKILYRSATILILDEPTAVLSPQEVERFFEVLNRMKMDGKSCIIITHKLYEVFQIADRITVMRDGVVTGHVEPEDMGNISVNRLAEYMVGAKPVLSEHNQEKKSFGNLCLEVKNLNCKYADKTVLEDISLRIRKGEILGVAGVEGNGQSELVMALTGLRKPDSMSLKLDGEEIHGTAKDFIKQGIGHIPEDRLKYAVTENMTIAENLVLGYQDNSEFSERGFMKLKKITSMSMERIKKYRIKAPDSKTLISQLSGGNQQKVVVARVFEEASKVLICSQLTRGVDISTSEFFYSLLRDFCERGGAVMLVSSDLEEVLKLSDTIAVMYKGKIAGLKPKKDFTREEIGILMTGGSLEKGGKR